MRESKNEYSFPCFRHNFVVLTKENYQRHLLRHHCIGGESGRDEIEKALLYPDFITSYVQLPENGKNRRICQVFYKIIKKKSIGKGRFLLDFWKVIIIKNFFKKRWEIATALLLEDSFEYAMINSRIEKILYSK
jgi:hypothetical protein